jgi:hypothetical protein
MWLLSPELMSRRSIQHAPEDPDTATAATPDDTATDTTDEDVEGELEETKERSGC